MSESRVCAKQGCRLEFLPRTEQQRYCSIGCFSDNPSHRLGHRASVSAKKAVEARLKKKASRAT